MCSQHCRSCPYRPFADLFNTILRLQGQFGYILSLPLYCWKRDTGTMRHLNTFHLVQGTASESTRVGHLSSIQQCRHLQGPQLAVQRLFDQEWLFQNKSNMSVFNERQWGRERQTR